MMKKASFKTSKAYQVAQTMPSGLRHSFPGEEFSINKSEAVQWLISQPEILNYLFSKIRGSGAISYDQTTNSWGGVNQQ